MYKLISLAVVATVAIAMPTDFQPTTMDVPVHADFPMPVVPWDFEATAFVYSYTGGRLRPLNQWSTSKYSSALNRIYDASGIIDENGDEVAVNIESTDATTRTAQEFTQGKPCTTADNVQVESVNKTIATYFEGFSYAGPQYAPWELTRVKYYRLDG